LDGREPALLSAGSPNYATGIVYARAREGTASQPSPLAVVRELFIAQGSLQERLVIENHAPHPASTVLLYEFDSDFLDLFEVKSTEFGERDLTFARTITPLFTSRSYDRGERAYAFSTSGPGFGATCLIWFSQDGIPGDRETHFEVEIP